MSDALYQGCSEEVYAASCRDKRGVHGHLHSCEGSCNYLGAWANHGHISGMAVSQSFTKEKAVSHTISTDSRFANCNLFFLQTFCAEFPPLKSWLAWWVARKSMTFCPFRAPALPAANIAEIGNAMLNIRNAGKNQYLVTALYRDCCTMLMQDQDVIRWKTQSGSVQHGRGPSVSAIRTKHRQNQLALGRKYGEALGNHLAVEMEVENRSYLACF